MTKSAAFSFALGNIFDISSGFGVGVSVKLCVESMLATRLARSTSPVTRSVNLENTASPKSSIYKGRRLGYLPLYDIGLGWITRYWEPSLDVLF